MKHNLLTLTAAICAAAMLTACNSDDNKTDEPEATPSAAVMQYNLTVSDDMLAAFDMTIEYYDTDGAVQNESMTETKWSKNVKAKLPATHGLRLTAKMKNGAEIDSDTSFAISYSYSFNGSVIASDGSNLGKGIADSNTTSLTIKGEKVSEWIARKNDGIFSLLYTFNEKGDTETGTWK